MTEHSASDCPCYRLHRHQIVDGMTRRSRMSHRPRIISVVYCSHQHSRMLLATALKLMPVSLPCGGMLAQCTIPKEKQ